MRNSQLLEGEAVILKADLERRGVIITACAGVIECEGSEAVIDRFAREIVRLKPALLSLFVDTGTDAQPDTPPLEVAPPGAPPQPLDENRNRLNRLESLLSSEGAAGAIYAVARHIEARNPDFWRQLRRESRHELAICGALLDNDLDPLSDTQTEGEEAR